MVSKAISQGSVLSPIFFILYTLLVGIYDLVTQILTYDDDTNNCLL